jgi:hypothetical protein
LLENWQPNSPVVLDALDAQPSSVHGASSTAGAGTQTTGSERSSSGIGAGVSDQASAAIGDGGVHSRTTFLRFSDKCHIVHVPPSPPQRECPPRAPVSGDCDGGRNKPGGGARGTGILAVARAKNSPARSTRLKSTPQQMRSTPPQYPTPPQHRTPPQHPTPPQPRFRCDSADPPRGFP